MRPLTLAAFGAATVALPLLLAACAPGASGDLSAASADARQCFFPSQVTNFRQGATQTLYLRARNEVYELSSAGFCRDIDTANSIVIRPLYSASDRLCGGDDAAIAIGGSRDEPCRVRVIRKLTAEEVEALPSRQRP